VVFGDVLYVGRQTCPPDGDCQTSPLKGSIEALKASDGTVLWHSRVDVHNDPFQSVQVMAVVNGIVYVEVGGYSSDAAGDVYALRASDGSHLWRYSIDPESVTDPQALQVAVGNAMVYVFKNGGTLHGIVALDANRGSQRWFYAADHLFALVVGS